MANLPDSCPAFEILSLEYQPYARGKIFPRGPVLYRLQREIATTCAYFWMDTGHRGKSFSKERGGERSRPGFVLAPKQRHHFRLPSWLII
jgi:hypothetical protein